MICIEMLANIPPKHRLSLKSKMNENPEYKNVLHDYLWTPVDILIAGVLVDRWFSFDFRDEFFKAVIIFALIYSAVTLARKSLIFVLKKFLDSIRKGQGV